MASVLTLFIPQTIFEPLLCAKNVCALRKSHAGVRLRVSVNPSLPSRVVWVQSTVAHRRVGFESGRVTPQRTKGEHGLGGEGQR